MARVTRHKIRKDNKRMAPCGERSAWYCWNHRYDDAICKKCDIYQCRGKRNKIQVIDGKKFIRCKNCGRLLPVSEFYLCKKVRFNMYGNPVRYVSYIYRCKECTYKSVRESQERRKGK